MSDKEQRQARLSRLLRSGAVGTQAEFQRRLRAEGHAVDQSTLSRDLVELGIRKRGGRYVPAASVEAEQGPPKPQNYAAAVRGFTTCGPHLLVVRTDIGQAQAVAVAMDEAQDPAILATLAGDDTIFVATKNRRLQAVALRRIQHWFGDKHER